MIYWNQLEKATPLFTLWIGHKTDQNVFEQLHEFTQDRKSIKGFSICHSVHIETSVHPNSYSWTTFGRRAKKVDVCRFLSTDRFIKNRQHAVVKHQT